MSQDQAYNRMIASLTRSVMLLMSIALIVFVFTSASDMISSTSNEAREYDANINDLNIRNAEATTLVVSEL